MQSNHYEQYITSSTTERDTLIDHVYVRNMDHADADVIPTYYSYHVITMVFYR